MSSLRFRKMLVELNGLITDDELASMKFMCADIPKRQAQHIHTSIKLWEALQEHEQLAPNDTVLLRELLETACSSRKDVMTVLNSYEDYKDERTEENPDLSAEIRYISKNAGRNWKKLIRALDVSEASIDEAEDQYRSLNERCYQLLRQWQQREKSKATKQRLLSVLCDCKLNQLAENVQGLS